MYKIRKTILSSMLAVAMLVSMIGPSVSAAGTDTTPDDLQTKASAGAQVYPENTDPASHGSDYPRAVRDVENEAMYADSEVELAQEFLWFRWEFEIDADLDAVGTAGDGIGEIYFRLFVPKTTPGEKYPVVEVLGVLGTTNTIDESIQATNYGTLIYASEVNQAVNPSYVLCFNIPYEACVNYDAELAYIYQLGEVAKWVAETYGNVDMDRIYATGRSQGAGWSYELASVQPDLLAAILIQAGTTVHSTWGDQCDLQAIADSEINVYIWHGYTDVYIPVNEAFRAYNTLVSLGKKNIQFEIQNAGHGSRWFYSETEITKYVEWLYEQEKGVPFTTEPIFSHEGEYSDFVWAGTQVFSDVEGWQIAYDYAVEPTPYVNPTWQAVQEGAHEFTAGAGGTGRTWLSRVRIGDETVTTYDDSNAVLTPGDTVAVTVQGYTGAYGDDFDAFNAEWDVEWAVLEGSVTNIEVTNSPSAEPIARPDTVTLSNGGGPNKNNSLGTDNALDGNQVYIKIDTAENFEGNTLKVALRFIRKLSDGTYSSCWHIVQYDVAAAGQLVEDTENKAVYAAAEDETIDTAGIEGDGKGLLYVRLYVPEHVDANKEYPLLAVLGGLGSTNSISSKYNSYAAAGSYFAKEAFQEEEPCYILTITVPYEACVNYEAELEYVNQFGEIIKAVAEMYDNIDTDRLYATGFSQGAGWTYELIAEQPELLAAAFINAGTTVHTTWGDQCDLQAIAASDTDLLIWHGSQDPYIPVNEAYRTYNTLAALGKTDMIMIIDDCTNVGRSNSGHCNMDPYLQVVSYGQAGTAYESFDTPVHEYMAWLFAQTKQTDSTNTPQLYEVINGEISEGGEHGAFAWAGAQVFSDIEGWQTAYNYAEDPTPYENPTWKFIQENAAEQAVGAGGTGTTYLSKVRIGDETSTTYDYADIVLVPGDTVAVTIQGYTGAYGDDFDAFNAEWDVQWAVLEGSVTNIELTSAKSETPISRPDSVTLNNGGGPNKNNSLATGNALDGGQVYLKIDTAEAFEGDTLKVAFRFIRKLEDGTYSSYWHVIQYDVSNALTRKTAVQMLYSWENPTGTWEAAFSDVTAGSGYSFAINWAAKQGIISGYGDGTFGPNDPITREQLAVILYGYAKWKGYDLTSSSTLSNFADGADTAIWARPAVQWAVENGLISGADDGTLSPQGGATCAQLTSILRSFAK